MGYDEKEEAHFVTRKCLKQSEGIPYKDMVIFYRTNAQSGTFEDQFLYMHFPYLIIGGVSFYQRKEIKDILAFLRMVHSGADFIAFARTINFPKRGVGEASLEKLISHASLENMPIFDFCED